MDASSVRNGINYLKQNLGSEMILGLFILFSIVFHFIAYTGHFGYDDLHYAKLAAQLNDRVFDANDHYSFRWTILLFTAFTYKLFGINDFASSLPALLLFIGILYLVYSILKNESREQLIIGLSLTAFSQDLLFYSDKLMPDIYVAFSVLLAIYVFWKCRYQKKEKDFLYAFIMVLALFMGFLSKGTIILALPLFLYLFVTDLVLKRPMKFWIYSFISGLFLLLAYVLIIWLITGSPFKRFEALESNAYLSLCSYGDQPISMLFERISTGFISLLVHQGMFIGFIFILAYFIQILSFDILRLNTSFSFFMVSSVILLLSSNFMSISTESYNPMCLDVRHYLFITPVIAIPASRVIYHFSVRRYLGVQILALLFIAIVSSYFIDAGHPEVYALLFVIFLLSFLIPRTFKKSIYFSVIFSLILLVIPAQMAYNSQKIRYNKQKEVVQTNIIDKLDKAVIVTDDIQKRLGDYYLGFNQYSDIKFESFKTFDWNKSGDEKKYILINPYTSYLAKHGIPYYAKAISGSSTPLFIDNITGLSLFDFHGKPKRQSLILSNNDFEQEYDLWEGGSIDDIESHVFSGSFSNKISEFSSSFVFVFDSAYNFNISPLIISSEFNCLLKAPNEAQYIIVLEKQGAEYFREVKLFNHHIKSIDHWWPAEVEVFINGDVIQPNSKLVIYIWNPDKKEMYIDDFKVEVTSLPTLNKSD